jgi:hypothetical protein
MPYTRNSTKHERLGHSTSIARFPTTVPKDDPGGVLRARDMRRTKAVILTAALNTGWILAGGQTVWAAPDTGKRR